MNLSKIVSTLVALTCLALTACGGSSSSSSSNDSTENNNTVDNSNSITAPDITGKVYKFVISDNNETVKLRFNGDNTADQSNDDIDLTYEATSKGNVVTVKLLESNGVDIKSTTVLTFKTQTSGTFKSTFLKDGKETTETGTFEESSWDDADNSGSGSTVNNSTRITGKVYKFVIGKNETIKLRFNGDNTADQSNDDIDLTYEATSKDNVVTVKLKKANEGDLLSTIELTFTTDTSGTFKVTEIKEDGQESAETGTFEESSWDDVVTPS